MQHIRQMIRSTAIVVALAFGGATAHAHAFLDHASPLVGSTVKSSPNEVRMWFTQALEPRFSGAQLRSSTGAVLGNGTVDTADPKQMVIPTHGLAPGRYKVTWKVLSVDTHRTEGSFSFEVKP
ncbi:MAG TPA: copper resistance protein CopC [Xanthobacteraceae bacterium]|nr:copper resistance protein CopC [Xanthobacteraceae bacterium]